MMRRNLFGAGVPPHVMRGEVRQALSGNAPGAKSRSAARARGMVIAGEPGSEGQFADEPVSREAVLRASLPSRFRRGGLFPFGQKSNAEPQAFDVRRLLDVVRQMMNGAG